MNNPEGKNILSGKRNYVLITPAYNEEAYLEKTIRSVIAQSLLPDRWVIVSDGSTDKTDEIAAFYAEKHQFIEFVPHKAKVNTEYGIAARKVAAIETGFKRLGDVEYQYFGNLDADISIGEDYYDSLIKKFEDNPKLGLGGSFIDNVYGNVNYPYFDNPLSVGGSIQFFRRQCWEDIGGYYPGAYEDSIAVTMARMKGWEVQSFCDIRAYHHKCAGLPGRSNFRAKFHVGRMEHIMGDHILWEAARCAADMFKKPVLLGSFVRFFGYTWSALKGNAIGAPDDVVQYARKEQLRRLKKFFR